MVSKPKNLDEAKREWIRRFPCHLSCTCPSECLGPVDCAHVKHGVKKDDNRMVPLCRKHHTDQHNWGNAKFGRKYDLSLDEMGKLYHEIWTDIQDGWG